MFAVGDRVSFLCVVNSDTFISECKTDGSWDITGIQCNALTTVPPTGIIGNHMKVYLAISYKIFIKGIIKYKNVLHKLSFDRYSNYF